MSFKPQPPPDVYWCLQVSGLMFLYDPAPTGTKLESGYRGTPTLLDVGPSNWIDALAQWNNVMSANGRIVRLVGGSPGSGPS